MPEKAVNAKGSIRNKLRVLLDPELRAIRRLIEHEKKNSIETDPVVLESDNVFINRIETFPLALKMSFWERHFELESLREFEEIHGHILDFGCGSGHLALMLARKGMVVHGIDLSRIGISIANFLKAKENAQVQSRLSFEIVDVTKQDRKSDLFDSAWSAHVFEHIANPGPVLAGLRTWLKPEAHLLISVPRGFAYDDPGHVNHFGTGEELRTFLSPYVTVKRISVSEPYSVIRALCSFN